MKLVIFPFLSQKELKMIIMFFEYNFRYFSKAPGAQIQWKLEENRHENVGKAVQNEIYVILHCF